MNPRTRQQILALDAAFYRAHAEAFDASRGHHPWPGWQRMAEVLALSRPRTASRSGDRPNGTKDPGISAVGRRLAVLDIGCGNARLARFLESSGFTCDYVGVDANRALLARARARLGPTLAARCEWVHQDFLQPEREPVATMGVPPGRASDEPGARLPEGPFDLIALMGILHHVPGRDWRLALLRAAAARLAPGGLLALATWQFADRERFARRTVPWSEVGPVLGRPIDPTELEPGDRLLRFGHDPTKPPRYCHPVSADEFESWPAALGLEPVADYLADGAEADLNRYWLLRSA